MTVDEAIALLPALQDAALQSSERFSTTYNKELSRTEIGARLDEKVFPILAILPSLTSADRELVVLAPQLVRAAYLIITLQRDKSREQKQTIADLERQLATRPAHKPEKTSDYAAQCAMKCAERGFQLFLIECHDLRDATDAERIAVRVREVLSISSRAELNTDPEAATRWRDLLADFEAWRKA